MSKQSRAVIVSTLTHILGDKNSIAYEKEIYKMCERENDILENELKEPDIEEIYDKFAYDKLGEIMACKDKDERKRIALDMRTNKIGWDSSTYKPIRDKIDIESDRIINPPEVKKGIFK